MRFGWVLDYDLPVSITIEIVIARRFAIQSVYTPLVSITIEIVIARRFAFSHRRLAAKHEACLLSVEPAGVSLLVDDERRRRRLAGLVCLSAASWGSGPAVPLWGLASGSCCYPPCSTESKDRGKIWETVGTGKRSWCTPLIRFDGEDLGKIGGGFFSCRSIGKTLFPGRSYSPPIHSAGGVVLSRLGRLVRYDVWRKRKDAVGRRLRLVLVAWAGVEVLLCLKV